jgi:hypothetical protein
MAVNAEHSDYTAAKPKWERARDAMAGQDAVHAKGELYLPKPEGYDTQKYQAYLKRTLFYGATGRTVDGLSGMVFRRPPSIEVPAATDYLEQDVDTADTPLTAFCEKVVDELLQVGRVGLLVDFPPMPNVRTLAEERAVGARPYIKTYCAESIINWKVERMGNRSMLTMVVLLEQAEVAKDEYTSQRVQQWRVLRLVNRVYSQELWQKKQGATVGAADEFEMVEGYPVFPMLGGKPMDFIPFLICGPMGMDVCVAKPPILDLADVNLSHYRTTADLEHGLHFTGLPTPVVTGHTFDTGETFALGSSIVKAFENTQAKAYFMEFTGAGLGGLEKRLEKKEEMMAALGARLLGAQKRTAEAAETAAIHRSGENGVLASLAIGASQAISRALNWCAQWGGVQEEAKVELNTDYLPTGLSAQELLALVQSWQAGAISHETLYDNLQRGEIAQQGVPFEEEQAKIEAEGPALGTMNEPPVGGPGANGQ